MEHDQDVLASGRHLDLVSLRGWEFVRRRRGDGVVAIIAVTEDDRLVLVEQHRPAVGGPVIELPAGLVADEAESRSETAEFAARREFEEETGYTARTWTPLCCSGPPPLPQGAGGRVEL